MDPRQEQRLLPVVNAEGRFVGVVTRGDIRKQLKTSDADLRSPVCDLVRTGAVEAYPDEPLRVVVYRMAEEGCSRMPVLDRATRQFLGLVSLNDLLKARSRHLEEERRRERTLKFRLFPGERPHRESDV